MEVWMIYFMVEVNEKYRYHVVKKGGKIINQKLHIIKLTFRLEQMEFQERRKERSRVHEAQVHRN